MREGHRPRPGVARRTFLLGGAAAAGGLLVGCSSPKLSAPGAGGPQSAGGDTIEKILADAPVASEADLATGAMAEIRRRGVLNRGGGETIALWSLKDPVTGQTKGFDAYMGQLLAKYILGKPETKLVIVDGTTREQLLMNGTVDVVLSTYSITLPRAEKVAFAGPYFMSGPAILTKKTNTDIKRAADLNGKDVAVVAGTTGITALQAQGSTAKLQMFGSGEECYNAVRQGRAVAAVNDYALLLGAVATNPDLTVVGDPFGADPYGIGLPKNQPEMKAFVNDWLKKIEDMGLWKRIFAASFGNVLGQVPQPPAIGSVPGS